MPTGRRATRRRARGCREAPSAGRARLPACRRRATATTARRRPTRAPAGVAAARAPWAGAAARAPPACAPRSPMVGAASAPPSASPPPRPPPPPPPRRRRPACDADADGDAAAGWTPSAGGAERSGQKLLAARTSATSSWVPSQPLLTCFYSSHRGFLGDDQLLKGCRRLRDIPCVAVQGANDLICPPSTALELHDAWPEMHLRVAPGAGHSMYDPALTHEVVEATDALRDWQGGEGAARTSRASAYFANCATHRGHGGDQRRSHQSGRGSHSALGGLEGRERERESLRCCASQAVTPAHAADRGGVRSRWLKSSKPPLSEPAARPESLVKRPSVLVCRCSRLRHIPPGVSSSRRAGRHVERQANEPLGEVPSPQRPPAVKCRHRAVLCSRTPPKVPAARQPRWVVRDRAHSPGSTPACTSGSRAHAVAHPFGTLVIGRGTVHCHFGARSRGDARSARAFSYTARVSSRWEWEGVWRKRSPQLAVARRDSRRRACSRAPARALPATTSCGVAHPPVVEAALTLERCCPECRAQ